LTTPWFAVRIAGPDGLFREIAAKLQHEVTQGGMMRKILDLDMREEGDGHKHISNSMEATSTLVSLLFIDRSLIPGGID
jgi:hypothetical protein